ncbi:hypothetical protein BV22DRAFT_1100629, partial [Leucogyrophana mollusca]
MPFIQHGANATANISTYNDVAGNQDNRSTTAKTVGNISNTAGHVGTGTAY